jgi:hypothetical protein
MNKGKNTAIEGQDLEENVFRAFVDIFYTGCVDRIRNSYILI